MDTLPRIWVYTAVCAYDAASPGSPLSGFQFILVPRRCQRGNAARKSCVRRGDSNVRHTPYFSPQVKQLGELGLMGVAISEENGGTGLDYLVSPHATVGKGRRSASEARDAPVLERSKDVEALLVMLWLIDCVVAFRR